MTRRMVYKLIWIVFLVLVALTFIYPTVGEKDIKIVFLKTATVEQIDAVKNKFASDRFSIAEDGEDSIIITGRSLTDAVKNDIARLPGIEEVTLLKTWVEDKLLAKKINLGLDLQGGMHLVLQANYDKILNKYTEDLMVIDKKLDDPKIDAEEKKQLQRDRDYITDVVLNEHDKEKREYSITDKYKSEVTQQALELLRSRVDKFGVSEPSIRPSGNEAIEIQLPGIKDINSVKNALGSTGSLEYRLVDDAWTEKADIWFFEKLESGTMSSDWAEDSQFIDVLLQEMKTAIKLPDNLQLLFSYERGNDKRPGKTDSKKMYAETPMALQKTASVVGTDISEATVNRDDYGQIIVSFRTTSEGAVKFAEATKEENRDKRLAIVLDNKVRNAPRINDPITTGNAQITGNFTYEEAMTLARIIKEGALPVDLQIIEERVVGPSLGADSIEAGVKAVLISLAGVMLFMFIYYKGAGLIANLGLILNVVFMIAILSMLGFTLTLPGIAGFILTIGMAIDANVIIYERIKEEIAAGKSVRMSIVAGYDRAFWTIVDANLTTLIAAFVLSQFGTGPIKGFAVTLMIGVLTSMFSALYITRFIYEIISLNKKIKKLSI